MPQIRPITDLRNTNEISELCHSRREPIFITKNGYGDLVIMSMETYEELTGNEPAPSAGTSRPADDDRAALDALWDNIRKTTDTKK